MTKEKNKTFTLEELNIEESKGYSLILINDNYTPFEFVVYCLMEVCGKSLGESIDIATKAHNNGESTVDIFESEDEANEFKNDIDRLNIERGYRLQTKVVEL